MGANPFLTMGNILVDIKKGNFGTAALQAADFQSLASKNSALTFINNPVSGWYTRAMAEAELPLRQQGRQHAIPAALHEGR